MKIAVQEKEDDEDWQQRCLKAEAALALAEELIQNAWYAHQKLGFEGCGNAGMSHEVRIFAQDYSLPQRPKTPQHTMLAGNGKYYRWWLRHLSKEEFEAWWEEHLT